jgi:hypothetical protein
MLKDRPDSRLNLSLLVRSFLLVARYCKYEYADLCINVVFLRARSLRVFLRSLEEWAWESLNRRFGNPAHLLLRSTPFPSEAGDVSTFTNYRYVLRMYIS